MPALKRPVPPAEIQRVLDAYRSAGTVYATAKALRTDRMYVQRRLDTARALGMDVPATVKVGEAPTRTGRPPPAFSLPTAPSGDVTLKEHLEYRKRILEERQRKHRWAQLIPVDVHVSGPVVIGIFGDPHVDDDACDLHTLEDDLSAITDPARPWVFGLNLGDLTNNWVGRLAKKYADQVTTHAQAGRLIEWMLLGDEGSEIRRRWLAVVAGNHDLWQGADAIAWAARQSGTMLQSHGVRLEMRFPAGDPIRIHARHDFPGRSIHNPTHFGERERQHGYRDDVIVAGHLHTDAYSLRPLPSERKACHTLRVSGYKVIDDYADENRFIESRLNPSAWLLIEPDGDSAPDRIKVYWSSRLAIEACEDRRRRRGL